VPAALRDFEDRTDALLWAAQQQTNRRNVGRDAQCLSILRALQRAGVSETRAQLADRFNFGDATVGRCQQLLNRASESEIAAVLEGKHGVRRAYELVLQREQAEAGPLPEDKEPKEEPEDDDQDDDDEDEDEDEPEQLKYARDMAHTVADRVDRLQELLGAEAKDAIINIKAGIVTDVLQELDGALLDVQDAIAKVE
jgi:hypothetical protein